MDTTTPRTSHDRPLTGLFSDLWRHTSALLQQEAQLAKAEAGQKVSQVGSATAAIAWGGAMLFAGFLVLLLAAVGALAMFLPPEHAQWLSPLIVGGIVLLIGFIALGSGRSKLKAQSLKPSQTIDSLRQDRDLAKEHLR